MTGPLEPATQAFIDSLYTLSPEAARNVLAGAQKSVSVTLAPARSEDRVLNVGPKGRTNVRIYRPENSKGTLPVVIYTGRKGAEAEARESDSRHREVQTELAHANRVTTMGKLTASISHEVKQPIAAMVTNAQAALHWLDRQPPDLEEVRQALASVVKDGDRARDVIDRIRALIKKAQPRKDHLEINGVIHEVIELTRGEALKNGVSVRTKLADGLPIIQGDRVHLQQVILNLIINAVEAMSGVSEGTRELLISTSKAEPGVLVAVRDIGPRTGASDPRARLRLVLHDQGERFGDRAVDLPFDHRSARGTVVGKPKRTPRRHFSIHSGRGEESVMKLLSVNVCLPKEIENTQLSPVAARIATGSITVMNAEVLSHEP